MAKLINFEDFTKEKAIELNDGTVLNVPERNAENYEALVLIESKQITTKEYDYCKSVLELLFGKDGFKKIAPKGKKTNLDYLAYVTVTAQELFLEDKLQAQKLEVDKKMQLLTPLVNHIDVLNPVIEKIK